MTIEEINEIYAYLKSEKERALFRKEIAISTGNLALYDVRFLKAMALIEFLLVERKVI